MTDELLSSGWTARAEVRLMGSKSKIEWTQATWNPIRGCSRVSPGCQQCYAERMCARKLPGLNSPTTGEPFATMKPDGPHWTGKVELIESALDIPLRRRKPTRYFVNSMSDLFHESLPNEAIDRVFAVMSLCPQHTFQVLTKRARRMQRYSVSASERISLRVTSRESQKIPRWAERITPSYVAYDKWWPMPNLWLGVSVEDRARKDRIDLLRKTQAAVRFLSLEPLLEDLGELDLTGISLVIVGGESGPGARPCQVDWIRSIVRQCAAPKTRCFVKQVGSNPVDQFSAVSGTGLPEDWPFGTDFSRIRDNWFPLVNVRLSDHKGADPTEWPKDLRVREMPEVGR